MAGLSFTSSGATPNNTNTTTPAMGSSGSLLSALGVSPGSRFGGGSLFPQTSTPAGNALNTAQTPAPAPAPTTPVKKTTVNNVDGSSHVTEYHAPETSQPATGSQPASQVYDPRNGGVTNIGGVDYQNGIPVTGYVAGSTQSQTAQTQTTPPAATTFGGILGSLTDASKGGSSNATTATTGLLNSPQQNKELSDQAKAIGTDYGDRIAKVSNYGNALAGSYTNGAGLAPVSQGLAGQAENTTANTVQGLQSAESAALAPINQELTAQQQAQSGLTSAGGIANAQQQTEQSGLTSAGTLAQPSPAAQGQTTFNPATGKFEGGSYQTNLGTVVQAIKNGQIGYTAGVDSLSGLSPTAKADVLAALGPGFDAVASDAAASAKGSNIQTGGTATTGANASGLAQSIQQETALQTAATGASNLATQVSDAINNAGLKLTNSTDANTAINNLQSRLGNDAYTKLNIAVNDARSAYAAILQSSGSATPTEAGQMANQNISANMSPNQILAAIDQLGQGVKARQDAAHQQTTQYQQQLSGSGHARTPSGTSTSGFGWNR